MIEIKEIVTKKEMKAFVSFPFSLYKNNPFWVPPIINDELKNLNKTINPVFKNAEATFFLAYQNNKIVGRVAAIINWTEVKEQKIKKMRFGWFDIIDDIEVSKALLSKVNEIGKQQKLDFIEGPVGFSNLDKVGVLTEGFDHIGTMITWYNHPYYKTHLEQLGYVKSKEWLENYMLFKNIDPNDFKRLSKIVAKRSQLKTMRFTKTKQLLPYVDKMFDLLDLCYTNLASYVPISDAQKKYFKEKFIGLINPEYIIFIADKEDNLVSFAITLPSFSKALQKANGNLFPFGFYHLLKAKKQSTDVIFYLIGIHPEYQNKGVTAMIFDQYYTIFEARGIEKLIRTPELEENTAIKQIWKHMKPITHKRRRTYKKDIK